MTDPRDALSEDDIIAAGEYVLGTLTGAERAAFAGRLAAEPALALEVARWEARLDPLADEVRPLAPPGRVWRGIEARLFGLPAPARGAAGLWGWFAGASGLAAALFAVLFWFGQPAPTGPGPLYISDMVSADGTVRLAALYDAKSGEMRVSMGGQAPGAGRDFELWLIAGQAAPISLGVMPREGQAAMPIAPELRPLLASATLAITEEPLGGAPQGVATGPLVAAAPLRRI